MVHRGGALLAGVPVTVFAVHARRRWADVAGARAWSVLMIGSLLVTAGLGAASGLLRAPAYLQDLHLAGAAAVLVCVVTLATRGWLAAADRARAEPSSA